MPNIFLRVRIRCEKGGSQGRLGTASVYSKAKSRGSDFSTQETTRFFVKLNRHSMPMAQVTNFHQQIVFNNVPSFVERIPEILQ